VRRLARRAGSGPSIAKAVSMSWGLRQEIKPFRLRILTRYCVGGVIADSRSPTTRCAPQCAVTPQLNA
jgi:hypothetical protein